MLNRLINIFILLLLTIPTLSAQSSTSDVPPPPSAGEGKSIFERIRRERPDMARIRREIVDRKSPYYYPTLMKEFQRNDTLMKLDKYRYLYLGYMFQEDYDPYRPSAFGRESYASTLKPNLTRVECDSVINHAKLVLEDNPFDLIQMACLISAYKLKGNIPLADIWQYKFDYILMAIVSTGTGLDEENAWYVTEPQHEYVLLNMMGLTVTNHVFYDPYYEYLKVRTPDGLSTGGFYFNIQHILNEYYRKNPDEY